MIVNMLCVKSLGLIQRCTKIGYVNSSEDVQGVRQAA